MTEPERATRVAVFGIFDGIHDGHRNLFKQAKKHGDELFVIVGSDSSAIRLKKKTPRYTQNERVGLVKLEDLVSEVLLGDEELSAYVVLRELDPGVICLGYDQQELAQDLQRWMAEQARPISVVMLHPFRPRHMHNSLFR